MKKVIKGKMYNTETAKAVGEMTQGDPGSFAYIWETLYLKRTGEYFLHGYGGARSRYAVQEGSLWGGGEKIIPLTVEEAQEWGEKYLTGEEYEKTFGIPGEDGEDVQLNAWISATSKAKLDRERSRTGETVAQVLERALKRL